MGGTEQDTLRVTTSDNVGIGYKVAGLASRVMAVAIDSLVAALILVLTYLVLAILLSTAIGGSGSGLAGILIGAAEFFVLVLYFTVAEAVTGGRSPGKSAMGIRVIRVDGGTPGFGACFLRNLAFIVDIGFGIGPILMFFHPSGRRAGDLIANTLVVTDRPAVSLAGVVQQPPVLLRTNDPGAPFPGLTALGKRDFTAVRTLLSRPGLDPEQRTRLAWLISRRLYERMGIPAQAPERTLHPELFLERVYMQMAPQHGP